MHQPWERGLCTFSDNPNLAMAEIAGKIAEDCQNLLIVHRPRRLSHSS
jgi:hypothetical protein